MTISDDDLIAFLDGELPADRCDAIEAALNADPALAARAEILAGSDRAVRQAFDAVLDEPVPAALMAAAIPTQVIDLAAARAARAAPVRPRLWFPAALAATLAVGFGIGTITPRLGQAEPLIVADAGGTRAGVALAAALSTARSGTDVAVPGGTMRGVISVRAGDGRLCRQFSVQQTDHALVALACRSGSEWQIEVASSSDTARSEYALAAGPGDAAISAALDALQAGAPLDAPAEQAALKAP